MPTLSPRETLEAPALLPVTETLELADRVLAKIVRRTGGQVRELRVEADEERVVLRGRSRTYHVKQLAQEAALDETGGWPSLANEIEVF